MPGPSVFVSAMEGRDLSGHAPELLHSANMSAVKVHHVVSVVLRTKDEERPVEIESGGLEEPICASAPQSKKLEEAAITLETASTLSGSP